MENNSQYTHHLGTLIFIGLFRVLAFVLPSFFAPYPVFGRCDSWHRQVIESSVDPPKLQKRNAKSAEKTQKNSSPELSSIEGATEKYSSSNLDHSEREDAISRPLISHLKTEHVTCEPATMLARSQGISKPQVISSPLGLIALNFTFFKAPKDNLRSNLVIPSNAFLQESDEVREISPNKALTIEYNMSLDKNSESAIDLVAMPAKTLKDEISSSKLASSLSWTNFIFFSKNSNSEEKLTVYEFLSEKVSLESSQFSVEHAISPSSSSELASSVSWTHNIFFSKSSTSEEKLTVYEFLSEKVSLESSQSSVEHAISPSSSSVSWTHNIFFSKSSTSEEKLTVYEFLSEKVSLESSQSSVEHAISPSSSSELASSVSWTHNIFFSKSSTSEEKLTVYEFLSEKVSLESSQSSVEHAISPSSSSKLASSVSWTHNIFFSKSSTSEEKLTVYEFLSEKVSFESSASNISRAHALLDSTTAGSQVAGMSFEKETSNLSNASKIPVSQVAACTEVFMSQNLAKLEEKDVPVTTLGIEHANSQEKVVKSERFFIKSSSELITTDPVRKCEESVKIDHGTSQKKSFNLSPDKFLCSESNKSNKDVESTKKGECSVPEKKDDSSLLNMNNAMVKPGLKSQLNTENLPITLFSNPDIFVAPYYWKGAYSEAGNLPGSPSLDYSQGKALKSNMRDKHALSQGEQSFEQQVATEYSGRSSNDSDITSYCIESKATTEKGIVLPLKNNLSAELFSHKSFKKSVKKYFRSKSMDALKTELSDLSSTSEPAIKCTGKSIISTLKNDSEIAAYTLSRATMFSQLSVMSDVEGNLSKRSNARRHPRFRSKRVQKSELTSLSAISAKSSGRSIISTLKNDTDITAYRMSRSSTMSSGMSVISPTKLPKHVSISEVTDRSSGRSIISTLRDEYDITLYTKSQLTTQFRTLNYKMGELNSKIAPYKILTTRSMKKTLRSKSVDECSRSPGSNTSKACAFPRAKKSQSERDFIESRSEKSDLATESKVRIESSRENSNPTSKVFSYESKSMTKRKSVSYIENSTTRVLLRQARSVIIEPITSHDTSYRYANNKATPGNIGRYISQDSERKSTESVAELASLSKASTKSSGKSITSILKSGKKDSDSDFKKNLKSKSVSFQQNSSINEINAFSKRGRSLIIKSSPSCGNSSKYKKKRRQQKATPSKNATIACSTSHKGSCVDTRKWSRHCVTQENIAVDVSTKEKSGKDFSDAKNDRNMRSQSMDIEMSTQKSKQKKSLFVNDSKQQENSANLSSMSRADEYESDDAAHCAISDEISETIDWRLQNITQESISASVIREEMSGRDFIDAKSPKTMRNVSLTSMVLPKLALKKNLISKQKNSLIVNDSKRQEDSANLSSMSRPDECESDGAAHCVISDEIAETQELRLENITQESIAARSITDEKSGKDLIDVKSPKTMRNVNLTSMVIQKVALEKNVIMKRAKSLISDDSTLRHVVADTSQLNITQGRSASSAILDEDLIDVKLPKLKENVESKSTDTLKRAKSLILDDCTQLQTKKVSYSASFPQFSVKYQKSIKIDEPSCSVLSDWNFTAASKKSPGSNSFRAHALTQEIKSQSERDFIESRSEESQLATISKVNLESSWEISISTSMGASRVTSNESKTRTKRKLFISKSVSYIENSTTHVLLRQARSVIIEPTTSHDPSYRYANKMCLSKATPGNMTNIGRYISQDSERKSTESVAELASLSKASTKSSGKSITSILKSGKKNSDSDFKKHLRSKSVSFHQNPNIDEKNAFSKRGKSFIIKSSPSCGNSSKYKKKGRQQKATPSKNATIACSTSHKGSCVDTRKWSRHCVTQENIAVDVSTKEKSRKDFSDAKNDKNMRSQSMDIEMSTQKSKQKKSLFVNDSKQQENSANLSSMSRADEYESDDAAHCAISDEISETIDWRLQNITQESISANVIREEMSGRDFIDAKSPKTMRNVSLTSMVLPKLALKKNLISKQKNSLIVNDSKRQEDSANLSSMSRPDECESDGAAHCVISDEIAETQELRLENITQESIAARSITDEKSGKDLIDVKSPKTMRNVNLTSMVIQKVALEKNVIMKRAKSLISDDSTLRHVVSDTSQLNITQGRSASSAILDEDLIDVKLPKLKENVESKSMDTLKRAKSLILDDCTQLQTKIVSYSASFPQFSVKYQKSIKIDEPSCSVLSDWNFAAASKKSPGSNTFRAHALTQEIKSQSERDFIESRSEESQLATISKVNLESSWEISISTSMGASRVTSNESKTRTQGKLFIFKSVSYIENSTTHVLLRQARSVIIEPTTSHDPSYRYANKMCLSKATPGNMTNIGRYISQDSERKSTESVAELASLSKASTKSSGKSITSILKSGKKNSDSDFKKHLRSKSVSFHQNPNIDEKNTFSKRGKSLIIKSSPSCGNSSKYKKKGRQQKATPSKNATIACSTSHKGSCVYTRKWSRHCVTHENIAVDVSTKEKSGKDFSDAKNDKNMRSQSMDIEMSTQKSKQKKSLIVNDSKQQENSANLSSMSRADEYESDDAAHCAISDEISETIDWRLQKYITQESISASVIREEMSGRDFIDAKSPKTMRNVSLTSMVLPKLALKKNLISKQKNSLIVNNSKRQEDSANLSSISRPDECESDGAAHCVISDEIAETQEWRLENITQESIAARSITDEKSGKDLIDVKSPKTMRNVNLTSMVIQKVALEKNVIMKRAKSLISDDSTLRHVVADTSQLNITQGRSASSAILDEDLIDVKLPKLKENVESKSTDTLKRAKSLILDDCTQLQTKKVSYSASFPQFSVKYQKSIKIDEPSCSVLSDWNFTAASKKSPGSNTFRAHALTQEIKSQSERDFIESRSEESQLATISKVNLESSWEISISTSMGASRVTSNESKTRTKRKLFISKSVSYIENSTTHVLLRQARSVIIEPTTSHDPSYRYANKMCLSKATPGNMTNIGRYISQDSERKSTESVAELASLSKASTKSSGKSITSILKSGKKNSDSDFKKHLRSKSVSFHQNPNIDEKNAFSKRGKSFIIKSSPSCGNSSRYKKKRRQKKATPSEYTCSTSHKGSCVDTRKLSQQSVIAGNNAVNVEKSGKDFIDAKYEKNNMRLQSIDFQKLTEEKNLISKQEKSLIVNDSKQQESSAKAAVCDTNNAKISVKHVVCAGDQCRENIKQGSNAANVLTEESSFQQNSKRNDKDAVSKRGKGWSKKSSPPCGNSSKYRKKWMQQVTTPVKYNTTLSCSISHRTSSDDTRMKQSRQNVTSGNIAESASKTRESGSESKNTKSPLLSNEASQLCQRNISPRSAISERLQNSKGKRNDTFSKQGKGVIIKSSSSCENSCKCRKNQKKASPVKYTTNACSTSRKISCDDTWKWSQPPGRRVAASSTEDKRGQTKLMRNDKSKSVDIQKSEHGKNFISKQAKSHMIGDSTQQKRSSIMSRHAKCKLWADDNEPVDYSIQVTFVDSDEEDGSNLKEDSTQQENLENTTIACSKGSCDDTRKWSQPNTRQNSPTMGTNFQKSPREKNLDTTRAKILIVDDATQQENLSLTFSAEECDAESSVQVLVSQEASDNRKQNITSVNNSITEEKSFQRNSNENKDGAFSIRGNCKSSPSGGNSYKYRKKRRQRKATPSKNTTIACSTSRKGSCDDTSQQNATPGNIGVNVITEEKSGKDSIEAKSPKNVRSKSIDIERSKQGKNHFSRREKSAECFSSISREIDVSSEPSSRNLTVDMFISPDEQELKLQECSETWHIHALWTDEKSTEKGNAESSVTFDNSAENTEKNFI